MVRFCLFDLDQTLVDTQDIEELRIAGRHRTDAAYVGEIQAAFRTRERHIVSEETLLALRQQCPDMKLGILTRSPRRYVEAVLSEAFPHIHWDAVVAYENVANCKPNGEGVYKAMLDVGMGRVADIPDVLLVGDSDVDIRAAYHAGCPVLLFKQGWPQSYERQHWRSLGLLPDAVVTDQAHLIRAITGPVPLLPDLECLLTDANQAPRVPRFDEIGKFLPNDRTRHVVYAAGRSFAGYETLEQRRATHLLTQSIQDNKDSEIFPPEWVATVKRFIAHHYALMGSIPFGDGPELIITVIPARPDRNHRLGNLLRQLEASYNGNPRMNRMRLSFDAGVLAYRAGVRSHSREHLSPEARFANVRDHLYVVNPQAVRGRRFLVIDDVSTTGATLLYAKQYLANAGASAVDCFSIAMNVSDPLRL